MSKFDNTVNEILQHIVLEQSELSGIDPDTIIADTQKQIEAKKGDIESYMMESKAKYDAGVNALMQQLADLMAPFQNFFNSPDAKIEEEVDWGAVWDKTKALGQKAAEKLGPVLHSGGEAVADTVGSVLDKFVDKKYTDDIENNLSESMWYKIAAVFDPTGVMSWPYYRNALDLYEQNKGTENEDIYFLNLLAAQISVIPGVRMPLAILTLPLKIITNPIRNIFGDATKRFARNMAKETRSKISKSPSLAKASPKLGKGKKPPSKMAETVKKASKVVASGALKAAKVTAVGAKTATVVGGGDIPGTWKKWTQDGKSALDNVKTGPATLGKFPSFNQLSTQ